MRCATFALSITIALTGIGALNSTTSQPALASCAASQPLPRVLASAPIVFVGKVIATRNAGRTATVHVKDVWRGANVPRTVTVLGSYVTGAAATSVDRTYTKGVRYLFVPEPTRTTPPYQDNNCTATQPYTPALAKYRPKGAHRP